MVSKKFRFALSDKLLVKQKKNLNLKLKLNSMKDLRRRYIGIENTMVDFNLSVLEKLLINNRNYKYFSLVYAKRWSN